MDKKTIGILFGGVSSEHDISTISAKGIISNINKEKYNLVLIGITKNGEWYLFDDDVEMLPNDEWLNSKSLKKAFISPDTSIHGVVTENGEKYCLTVSMQEIEQQLDPNMFFRLNRQYLVNISSLRKISPYFNSKLIVKLHQCDDEKIIVSRERSLLFKKWLDQ